MLYEVITTYHFAHAVDDHLMRVTHVVRAEEWLSTLPIHVQLFDALGFERPLYCHTAQLMKVDNGNKRKLSKRKDPELGLDYYRQEGYTVDAVWEYLMTILNSNYEACVITSYSIHYTKLYEKGKKQVYQLKGGAYEHNQYSLDNRVSRHSTAFYQ